MSTIEHYLSRAWSLAFPHREPIGLQSSSGFEEVSRSVASMGSNCIPNSHYRNATKTRLSTSFCRTLILLTEELVATDN